MNTHTHTHIHKHTLCTATLQQYSHSLWDNTNGVKWLFIRAPPGLSSEEICVMKFPLWEYRLNCVFVCSFVAVFLSHCPSYKGKKKTAHRNTEKQGHKGQKQSRHVVSLLPSIVLVEAARASPFYIFEISSICSALLILSLSGCQLSLPPFFHPNFLPSCQKPMSFMRHMYTQYLCWHSRSSGSYTSGLWLCLFLYAFCFFKLRRRELAGV